MASPLVFIDSIDLSQGHNHERTARDFGWSANPDTSLRMMNVPIEGTNDKCTMLRMVTQTSKDQKNVIAWKYAGFYKGKEILLTVYNDAVDVVS